MRDFFNLFLKISENNPLLYIRHRDTQITEFEQLLLSAVDKKYINIQLYTDEKEIHDIIDICQYKRVIVEKENINIKTLIDIDVNIDDLRLFVFSNSKPNTKHTLSRNKYTLVDMSQLYCNSIPIHYAIVQEKKLSNQLYINLSDINGFGVFSNNELSIGTSLFTLYGEIVDLTLHDLKSFKCEWNALDNNTLLVRKERTTYGFINHSRDPNLYIDKNTMTIIVRKRILKDEELLLDYREEPLPFEYIEEHGDSYL